MFYSYEGEGPNLGLKTAFTTWEPGDTSFGIQDRVDAVYVLAEKLAGVGAWVEFIQWYTRHRYRIKDLQFTVECPLVGFLQTYHSLLPGYRFVTVEEKRALDPDDQIFVKVRVLEKEHLSSSIDVANFYAVQGHQVLLMPEYNDLPEGLGRTMTDHWHQIESGVRFMPPVHRLLDIR